MAIASDRRNTAILIVLLLALLVGTACQSSLNADEFIAATLGGRAGEIRANLGADLSEDEKTAAAQYVAALESLSGETLLIVQGVGALHLATRATAEAVAAGYRDLAARSDEATARLRWLSPPPVIAAAHEELIVASIEHTAVVAAYAEAFAQLDFPTLQRLRAEHEAAARRILAAHERLERESAPLFQPGKRLQLSRR